MAPARTGVRPSWSSRPRGAGLDEAAALWWRPEVTPRTLIREGRRWTAWTSWVAVLFAAPGIVLLLLSPLTLPVALGCFAHAWLIPRMQASRGARALIPLGSAPDLNGAEGPDPEAGRVALGLLADLVDHEERDLLTRSGLVLERGQLGVWLVGERGALMVRPGGRRVDSWCVRVAHPDGLPAADRVAHLLLALREDEGGFAKVANLGFSGAPWRVRRRLPEPSRHALDHARRAAR